MIVQLIYANKQMQTNKIQNSIHTKVVPLKGEEEESEQGNKQRERELVN